MRIKNKEIKKRRHRKEQIIKAAEKALREQYSGQAKPAGSVTEKAPVKKAAARADAKPVAKKAPAKKVDAEAADKPKKAPAKKKADDATEESN